MARRAPPRIAVVAGARNSGFDSRLPDLRPAVVTEACCSDTAAAVVRLHLGPLRRETNDDDTTIETPASDRFRGRGVKAAQQTFNLAGEGSTPSGPNSNVNTGSRC